MLSEKTDVSTSDATGSLLDGLPLMVKTSTVGMVILMVM